jgi:dolichol-phosphate mannosyltransferase
VSSADSLAPGIDTIVVIPTYNERENIRQHVTDVLDLNPEVAVLIVDDSSPDGTGEIADELVAEYRGRVFVQHRMAKEGLGRAYLAGFRRALEFGTPLIAQMDADHSHRPVDLAKLIAAAPGTDLVLGSRYVAGGETYGWPWHRKFISRAGGIYASVILGAPIKDFTGGFKVWHREMLEAIDLDSIHSDGYCFQIETTFRALRKNARVKQVPIRFHDRVAGKSKLSRRVVIEAAVAVWPMRFRQIFHRPW